MISGAPRRKACDALRLFDAVGAAENFLEENSRCSSVRPSDSLTRPPRFRISFSICSTVRFFIVNASDAEAPSEQRRWSNISTLCSATDRCAHGGNRIGERQTANGVRFSAAPPTSLLFRPFSFRQSSSKPAKSLRKGCGKAHAQSHVQKVRKRRGKSADSPADLLRESGEYTVGNRRKCGRVFVELTL